MNKDSAEARWKTYCENELREVSPFLHELGYVLDASQSHISGERYLMVGKRDVGGGGLKLVLTGRRKSDGTPVVIKTSNDKDGTKEIRAERIARETVRKLRFSYGSILVPDELYYGAHGSRVVFITEYIEQEMPFLERETPEQFSLLLGALKAQESFHATTSSHTKDIQSMSGGLHGVDAYLSCFAGFRERTLEILPKEKECVEVFSEAENVLRTCTQRIEQYGGFLTHADFVPHNLKVRGGVVYLLDAASLHFGNKHESWARLTNFMMLYNRDLERALVEYIANNRAPEELQSLRLLRIYKAGKLVEYHASTLPIAEGSMHELSLARCKLWLSIMKSLTQETAVSDDTIEAYRQTRDSLRSPSEINRQKALH